jgi:hypothetical protein
MSRWISRLSIMLLAAASCSSLLIGVVHADTPHSSNYRFDETVIGGGGLINSSSASFQTLSQISDLGVGNTASSNFQIESGSVTTNDPALAFVINSGSPAFSSSFSPTTASTATATFSVSNYTSYGYVVQLFGTAPTNGGHTITALASGGTSSPGSEQFGLNLVANTSPASFGANPSHGLFAFGDAATNYDTPNTYRFVSGETIASAPKSSGFTTYTISYMVNVSSITPGGQYNSNQTLIVTGTY